MHKSESFSGTSSIKLQKNATSSGRQSASPLRQSSILTHSISTDQINKKNVCPICNNAFPTLLHLNKHLDEDHVNDEEPSEQIIGWLKSVQKKVFGAVQKNGLSLDNLNIENVVNKINNEEVFELNSSDGNRNFDGSDIEDKFVSRSHWQLEGNTCNHFKCKNSLGIRNGKQNCRRCGKLFCEIHCSLQMKLARDTRHDLENGHWSRVCLTCFQFREGYHDTQGVQRKRTNFFLKKRKEKVDKVRLESNMLEKRLEKISKLYLGERSLSKRASIANLTGFAVGSNWKKLEKELVPWEDDNLVESCPDCSLSFGLLNRRHHCRLCGKVVCGNDTCVIFIHITENVEVLSCIRCKTLSTRRKEALKELVAKPVVVLLYQEMKQIKTVVEEKLPLFNNMLFDLRSKSVIKPDDADYHSTARARKVLIDLLAQLDGLGKKVKNLPTESRSLAKLHFNIYLSTVEFLQLHMLTLQMMPKVTKEKEDNVDEYEIKTVNFEALKKAENLKINLNILKDQRVQINATLETSLKRRKFEDCEILKENLLEIDEGIKDLERELQLLDI
ncbi:carboxypeptidase Y-deficient [Lobulomyces angularis]|nr:carboxypeptidase Y-deficient [Lobulomyces angularis]